MGAQREPLSLCPWGMQKRSTSPQENLTASADLPPVNCKEISGPEDSMCCIQGDNCQPGQHEEEILGRHDTTQLIVARCHLRSCQALPVGREHILNKDSEGGVVLGWTCSVQPLALLWPQNHLVRERHRPGAPHGDRAGPGSQSLSHHASPKPGSWRVPRQPQPWASDISLGTG